MTASAAPESIAPPPSTFVTVLAWLGILYHGGMLFVGGLEAFMFRQFFRDPAAWKAMMTPPGGMPNAMDVFPFASRMLWGLLVGLLVWALVGLAASIGLLRRRNWARVTTIVLLALSIAWMLAMLAIQVMTAGITLPPPAEGVPDMTGMIRSMRIVMSILSVTMGAGCGWVIYKLVSEPIRAEFVQDA